jgi:hypothetical protein
LHLRNQRLESVCGERRQWINWRPEWSNFEPGVAHGEISSATLYEEMQRLIANLPALQ